MRSSAAGVSAASVRLLDTLRLRIALALILVIAAAVRINGANGRVVLSDEAITLVRTSGWTTAEIGRALDDGRTHRLRDIAAFTKPRPSSRWTDTVRSLAIEDAQHPPLYYLAERLALPRFGPRTLGIVIGLALVVAVFLLMREAGAGEPGALCAAALAAVSPVFVLYALQLREYELFALLTALSTCVLLRAAHTGSRCCWIAYAVTMALTLWCASFALLLPLAHAAILFRRRAVWRPFLAATLAALASWVPWLLVIVTHWSRVVATNEWSAGRFSVLQLLGKTAFNVSTTLFDAEYGDARWLPYLGIVTIITVAAGVAAMRRVADDDSRTGLALVFLTILPLLLADVLFASHRSASTRYLIPAYLGVIVLLGSFLARLPGRGGAIAATIVIAGAMLSSVISTSARSWWDNYANTRTPAVAAALAARPETPLIHEGPCASMLALALAGAGDTRVRCDATAAQLDREMFVLSPSPRFLTQAKAAGFRATRVVGGTYPSALVAAFRGAPSPRDLETLWLLRNT
jgi:uncharacterized membrane protein